MQTNSREAMLQNLKDAGCDPDIIGKTKGSLRVLASHRAAPLDELHDSRAKLDCLDYLIHKLRKDG